jgi:hypothetical protein
MIDREAARAAMVEKMCRLMCCEAEGTCLDEGQGIKCTAHLYNEIEANAVLTAIEAAGGWCPEGYEIVMKDDGE